MASFAVGIIQRLATQKGIKSSYWLAYKLRDRFIISAFILSRVVI